MIRKSTLTFSSLFIGTHHSYPAMHSPLSGVFVPSHTTWFLSLGSLVHCWSWWWFYTPAYRYQTTLFLRMVLLIEFIVITTRDRDTRATKYNFSFSLWYSYFYSCMRFIPIGTVDPFQLHTANEFYVHPWNEIPRGSRPWHGTPVLGYLLAWYWWTRPRFCLLPRIKCSTWVRVYSTARSTIKRHPVMSTTRQDFNSLLAVLCLPGSKEFCAGFTISLHRLAPLRKATSHREICGLQLGLVGSD